MGETALHKAVACGELTCIEILATRGAAINAAKENGRTPLHFMTLRTFDFHYLYPDREHTVRMAKALLRHGADRNHADGSGRHPADYLPRDVCLHHDALGQDCLQELKDLLKPMMIV